MKRIALSSLLLCVVADFCMAQGQISFLDIPLEGSLDSYTNKLVKEKGFTIAEFNDYKNVNFTMETQKLIGDFEGFKNCNVYIRQMEGLTEVSSVLIEVDTISTRKEIFENIVALYDSLYGTHIGYFDEFEWPLKDGSVYAAIDEGHYSIAFTSQAEKSIRNQMVINKYMDARKQRETVKEICGIPFGTSYEDAKSKLENKYGYSEYSSDRTTITFKRKSYAGIMFDTIHFLFESDGVNSFMNGCVFIMDAESLKEAETKRDMLYEKLSEKYYMLSDKDKNGNKYYIGGYAPVGDSYAFAIDIVKYDRKLAQIFVPYSARLIYGKYQYVKEEF